MLYIQYIYIRAVKISVLTQSILTGVIKMYALTLFFLCDFERFCPQNVIYIRNIFFLFHFTFNNIQLHLQ